MKVRYFADTDTLYLLLNDVPVSETKELDENTLLEVDEKGNLVGLTIEHAYNRVDMSTFSYEGVAVPQPQN